VVDFSNHIEAQSWFARQPGGVSVTFAARAGLRVLPLVVSASKTPEFPQKILLPSFWVVAVAWAAAKNPSHRARLHAVNLAADAVTHAANAYAATALGTEVHAAATARATARAIAGAAEAATGATLPTAPVAGVVGVIDAATVAAQAYSSALASGYPAAAAANAFIAAAGADAAAIDNGKTRQERATLAAEVAGTRLWPSAVPAEISVAWSELKTTLATADEGWGFWIAWYEDRLAGRPSISAELDIAIANLPHSVWGKNSRAVNEQIRQLVETERVSFQDMELIPPQSAGPHFGLHDNDKIGLVSPSEIDAAGNNIGRIRELLPLVRRAAERLARHLGSTNAYTELAYDVAEYRAAIGSDGEPVAWGVVFGAGVLLENAAVAANRQIENRIWPPLEDAAQADLDSLLTLHGPLILATAEGRELMEEADRYRLTHEEQAALRQDAQIVAGHLRDAPEIIEQPAAQLIERATEAIGEGRHPARGTVFGMATVKHVATILVPAAMLGAFDAAAAHFVGGELGTAIGGTAAAAGAFALAERERLRAAARALGSDFERLVEFDRATVLQKLGRLAPFHRFVRANEEPLRRIATNSAQLHWMLSYIDFIVRAKNTPRAAPQSRRAGTNTTGALALAPPAPADPVNYDILFFGGSYASLLAIKMLFGGHKITMVCLPAEIEALNSEGARVRLPIRGRKEPIELDSRKLPGSLKAAGPGDVDPNDFDLVALALQEPQYRLPGVRELLDAVAKAKVPCMSIMNIPPLPYLKRIPGLATDALRSCYTDASVWDSFEPGLVTLCSPDPQAIRPAGEKINVLQVTLPTNFHLARFESETDTSVLRQLEAEIEAIRYDPGDGAIDLPVKLKVHESIFVPLAKWAMLLTGNYRCVTPDRAIDIKDAVHSDLAASITVYNWVIGVCEKLGASPNDLVAFERYAAAANDLVRPSSAARALFNGATNIERTDRLVQTIGGQYGMHNPIVDQMVATVDARLAVNRKSV
jgi:hypothetical protein